MKWFTCIGCLLLRLLSAPAFAQQPAADTANGYPVAPHASLQLVSDQFSFTEGPAADKAGNVFFTDQPNNRIWEYDTGGHLSVFMENAGRSNGLYFDPQGNLLSCADEQYQLWRISPNKQVTVLVKDLGGHYLNGPNDVWVSRRNIIYFTDPYYQRDYWQRTKPDITGEKVYYLPKGAAEPLVADDSLQKPNGIIGTQDGRYLYVADIQANKTFRYTIRQDGSLGNKQLFVPQGSDGMGIDEQGNVYLTGKGVTVYNSEGKKIKHIPVPAEWTANVCFGGKNHDVLFITAGKNLFTLQMQVRGGE